MSSINFVGLGSGLDTRSIVSALLGAARVPLARLTAQQSDVQSQRSTLSDIRTLVQDIATRARAVDTTGELSAHTATSSDPAALAVAAGGGAQPGQYTIVVNELATAQRSYTAPFADAEAPGLLPTGTLTIAVGTAAPTSFTLDGTTTLSSLAGMINDADAGVSASVFFDGFSYRLQLAGRQTGADQAITFGGDVVSGLGLDQPTNTVSTARDAALTIDGFAVSSPGNTINDAIAGVTLELITATGAPVQVSVARDVPVTIERVEALVAAYNATVEQIGKATAWTGVYDPSRLTGDSTLRLADQQLRRAFTDPIAGLSDDLQALVQAGIKTGAGGTLTVDPEKLSTLLASRPGDVLALVNAVAARVAAVADRHAAVDGPFAVRDEGLGDQLDLVGDQIERLEARLADYEVELNERFALLEQLMSSLSSQNAFLLQSINASRE